MANDGLFGRLATLIDRADLSTDSRFASDPLRGQNEAALRAEIEQWSTSRTVAQVVDVLLTGGIPAAPVQSVKEAALSEHARHRGLFPEVAHPTLGRLSLPEQPVHFAGAKRGELRPAPHLGADTDAILAEVLEFDASRISGLRADGVI